MQRVISVPQKWWYFVENKVRPDQTKKYEALLYQQPCQTQTELTKSLEETQQTTFVGVKQEKRPERTKRDETVFF